MKRLLLLLMTATLTFSMYSVIGNDTTETVKTDCDTYSVKPVIIPYLNKPMNEMPEWRERNTLGRF